MFRQEGGTALSPDTHTHTHTHTQSQHHSGLMFILNPHHLVPFIAQNGDVPSSGEMLASFK